MHLLNAFYTGIELRAMGNANKNKMWTGLQISSGKRNIKNHSNKYIDSCFSNYYGLFIHNNNLQTHHLIFPIILQSRHK